MTELMCCAYDSCPTEDKKAKYVWRGTSFCEHCFLAQQYVQAKGSIGKEAVKDLEKVKKMSLDELKQAIYEAKENAKIRLQESEQKLAELNKKPGKWDDVTTPVNSTRGKLEEASRIGANPSGGANKQASTPNPGTKKQKIKGEKK